MTSFYSATQFTSIKPLGRGGFGVAAHVRRNTTSNEYVLKQVDLTAISNAMMQNHRQLAEKVIDMARTEHTKLLQFSHHPNIVQAYGAFEEDSNEMMTQGHRMYYLVMEYCQGGDLNYLITHTELPIPALRIHNWAKQLVSAVHYLHGQGLFHRDIKPTNIFLMENQQICKLGDFGLAKEEAEIAQGTGSFTAIGTPLFCAPEYFQKKPYTAKADIWSLGATLYNVATLKPPFEAEVHILSDRVKPKEISPEYSRDLADFIMRMLEKDPAKRPNIEQVMAHAFLQQDPSSSLSESSFGQNMPAIPNNEMVDARSNSPSLLSYSADRGDLVGSSPASFTQTESMASANNLAEAANPPRPQSALVSSPSLTSSSGHIDLPTNIQPASFSQIGLSSVHSPSSIHPPIPSTTRNCSISPLSSNVVNLGNSNTFQNTSFADTYTNERLLASSPATCFGNSGSYPNCQLVVSAPNGQCATLGNSNSFLNAKLQIVIDPPNGRCNFGNSNDFLNATFMIQISSDSPYRQPPIDCGNSNNFKNCTFSIQVYRR